MLVISRYPLIREGLKRLIAGMPFKMQFERETIESAVDQPLREVALCLVGVTLESHLIEPLRSLRAAYPEARIVCYTPEVRLPLSALGGVFESSLDGCVLSTSPLKSIRPSIDLVMTGEKIFPASVLLDSVPNQHQDGRPALATAFRTFSSRELNVMSVLRDGKTNKLIARELGLSEATVKIHVKNVLRKLGVSNRTEAAIWITTHFGGLESGGPPESGNAESPDRLPEKI